MKHLTQNNKKNAIKTRFNAFILRLWYHYTQTLTKRKQTAKKTLKTAILKHYKNTAKNKTLFYILIHEAHPPQRPKTNCIRSLISIFFIFFFLVRYLGVR